MSDVRTGIPMTFRWRKGIRRMVHALEGESVIITQRTLCVFGKWLIHYGPMLIYDKTDAA